jgi:hypothetical protein
MMRQRIVLDAFQECREIPTVTEVAGCVPHRDQLRRQLLDLRLLRLVVEPRDTGDMPRRQIRRDGLIGRNHALFHQLMGYVILRARDARHHPTAIRRDLDFRHIQIEREPREAASTPLLRQLVQAL